MAAADAAHASVGEWVVTQLLIDAINPQYADRIRPPVATLWQMLKEPVPRSTRRSPPLLRLRRATYFGGDPPSRRRRPEGTFRPAEAAVMAPC